MQQTTYRRLTNREREEISRGLAAGISQVEIARKINYHHATLSREIGSGTNENTNGLIRQYFPKGTDFAKVSRYQIKKVQRRLNDRPRAVLDYKKPDEVINRLVALKV